MIFIVNCEFWLSKRIIKFEVNQLVQHVITPDHSFLTPPISLISIPKLVWISLMFGWTGRPLDCRMLLSLMKKNKKMCTTAAAFWLTVWWGNKQGAVLMPRRFHWIVISNQAFWLAWWPFYHCEHIPSVCVSPAAQLLLQKVVKTAERITAHRPPWCLWTASASQRVQKCCTGLHLPRLWSVYTLWEALYKIRNQNKQTWIQFFYSSLNLYQVIGRDLNGI